MPRKRRRAPTSGSNSLPCSSPGTCDHPNDATSRAPHMPSTSANTDTHSGHVARDGSIIEEEPRHIVGKDRTNSARKDEQLPRAKNDKTNKIRNDYPWHIANTDLTDGVLKDRHCHIVEGKAVTGNDITLEVIQHDSTTCFEFVVSSPKFSFPKWLCLTAVFNGMGFIFNLHSQDQYLMTAVLAILLVVLLLKIHFKVKKESLLVMSTIGVQLSTTFASGRTSSHFICLSGVKDVIINEAVSMHSVIFYICLLLHKSTNEGDTLIPLFTKTWPRLSILQHIHQRTRRLLWKNS